jgi:D-sedoheptulose 7-phosphate isomerase
MGGPASEPTGLLATLEAAFMRKARESAELQTNFFTSIAAPLGRCVRTVADRFRKGGRLFVMGNGGSACDAQHLAVEFQHPIIEKRRALPAQALGLAPALLSAVGNDGDFGLALVTELDLVARPEDVALGISSSGASANVNRALRRARERGLCTVGFGGRDGGPMLELCDFCFVVPSWSIHRIQEAHTTLLHLLWDGVHVALGEDDVL